MKLKKYKNDLFLIILICFFMVILYGVFTLDYNLVKIGFLCSFGNIIIFLSTNFNENIVMLCFLFTFFIFTMGQYIFTLSDAEIMNYYDMFNYITIIKTILIQYISVLCTLVAYYLCKNLKKKKFKDNISSLIKCINEKKIMYLLVILFFISLIYFSYIGMNLYKYGYHKLYNNSFNESYIVKIMNYIKSCFPLCVYIFLYFFKSKKTIWITVSMYFIYNCFTLLTGTRGEFCIGILMTFIILYYCIKVKFDIKFSIKNSVIIIIILMALAVLLIFGLNMFNKLRNHKEIKNVNLWEQVNNFFGNQGSSVTLISIAQENIEKLTEKEHYYTFGPLFENVIRKISRLYSNITITSEEEINLSFAREISIIGLGAEGYNSGQGLGSQYIAEVLVDYGIFGVIIYSLILGICISIISDFYKYNLFGFSLSLILMQSILYLPRNQAIQPINAILSFNYWIILLGTYFFIIRGKKEHV